MSCSCHDRARSVWQYALPNRAGLVFLFGQCAIVLTRLETLDDGKKYPLKGGSIYILDKNNRHKLRAKLKGDIKSMKTDIKKFAIHAPHSLLAK
ncbi:MAG: ectoine synthase [Micavibrio sp.]|nr:ectoine synthase [Micavibrio sp.]